MIGPHSLGTKPTQPPRFIVILQGLPPRLASPSTLHQAAGPLLLASASAVSQAFQSAWNTTRNRTAQMAPKARLANKGPTVVKKDAVMLDTISILRPTSGWRDPDAERVKELEDAFYAGQWGMNVLQDVCLLDHRDMDGRQVIDDGLSTITALKNMRACFLQDQDATPVGDAWPQNIVSLFENGVPVIIHKYEEDTDLDLREAWQAARHDEECNKFKKTAVATFISVASKAHQKNGSDWTRASKHLLEVYGSGRSTSVYRWIRAAKQLPTPVAHALKRFPDVKTSFVFDNHYLLGTGAHENLKMRPEYAIQALEMASEDPDMSAKDFQEKVCKPLKLVDAWSFMMVRRFGQVASASKAFARVVAMLRTQGGLRKVIAMSQAGTVLHGTGENNPGIVECHSIVAEMEKCKAGGHPPPAVLPSHELQCQAGTAEESAQPADTADVDYDENAANAVLAALSGVAKECRWKRARAICHVADFGCLLACVVRHLTDLCCLLASAVRHLADLCYLTDLCCLLASAVRHLTDLCSLLASAVCRLTDLWCLLASADMDVVWGWGVRQGARGGRPWPVSLTPIFRDIVDACSVPQDDAEQAVAAQEERLETDMAAVQFHADWRDLMQSSTQVIQKAGGRTLVVVDCPTSRIGVLSQALENIHQLWESAGKPDKCRLLVFCHGRFDLVAKVQEKVGTLWSDWRHLVVQVSKSKFQSDKVRPMYVMVCGARSDWKPNEVPTSHLLTPACRRARGEALCLRCTERACSLRPAGMALDDADGDTTKEISPEDKELDMLALMQAEAAELSHEDDQQGLDDDDDDTVSGPRKRDYLVDLWPFAHPSSMYAELFQVLGKSDASNVAILITGSAHPGSWLALRRVQATVFVHTARLNPHALGHGMAVARRLRAQDLQPVDTTSAQKFAHSGAFEMIEGPDLSDEPQVIEAWDVTQGETWYEGLNLVLPAEQVANNMQTLFDSELQVAPLRVKAPEGQFGRGLVATRGLREAHGKSNGNVASWTRHLHDGTW